METGFFGKHYYSFDLFCVTDYKGSIDSASVSRTPQPLLKRIRSFKPNLGHNYFMIDWNI